VGEVRNLRQEPVEWIKEQSNIFIIFNSFEVAFLPVIHLIFPSELWNDSIMVIIDQKVEGKPVNTQMD
jgi:hypothetical protein